MTDKDTIISLVKEINKDNSAHIIELTEKALENDDYISIIYQLVFHTYKRNPELAYYMLCGFINYGKKNEIYKPMIDHYLMEAFDGIVSIGGWSILKECINIMRYNVENIHNEPIFIHILYRVVAQLYKDNTGLNMVSNMVSNICYNLPREKSFTWGWFSYHVAHAYFAKRDVFKSRDNLNTKQMRKYLMQYRKLITKLRNNVLYYEPIPEYRVTGEIEETWVGIISALSVDSEYMLDEEMLKEDMLNDGMLNEEMVNEYMQSKNILNNELEDMLTADYMQTVEAMQEESAMQEDEIKNDILSPEGCVMVPPEPAAPEPEPEPAGSSWLYKLFTWS